jgi:glycosyltransferase involved in cell wall biosynthesis
MKRIAMVAYSFYESDNRVMRYAEALRERGDFVDVFAIAAEPRALRSEVLNGVNIYRLQSRSRDEKGKWTYFVRIFRFFLSVLGHLSLRTLRNRYDVIHVHNVPDFLVFSSVIPKLMGARIILDIHDLLPEFFASKFSSRSDAGYVRILAWIEKVSCKFADHVIISNDLWWQKITSRSVSTKKCTALVNYVDTKVFYPRKKTRADGKVILLFPGGMQAHQGIDIAIKAIPLILKEFPQGELHLYGDGNVKPALIALATELGLSEAVRFFEPQPIKKIAEIIAQADVGIVPKRADSFGDEAYSTKIMEFMSQGLPVVASRTKIDSYYFDDSLVYFFESGNIEQFAGAVKAVLSDPALSATMRENGLKYVARNNWETRKKDYFFLVDGEIAVESTPADTINLRPDGAPRSTSCNSCSLN